MISANPYLSVVVTSRNDDHGGSLLRRTQTFLNGFFEQCRRYSLSAELIFVEWNPPEDRPPLHEALKWPDDLGGCSVRFIVVPREVHQRYQHAEALPLYQMIAKNVGIRRARGEYILATNIDIVFSNELIQFVADRRLEHGRMYRLDRYDSATDVPVDGKIEDRLEYCRNNVLRINERNGTFPVKRQPQDSQGSEGNSRKVKRETDTTSSAVIVPGSSVSLGAGWFEMEQRFGQLFHWAERDAVIKLPEVVSLPWRMSLELEPGPSAASNFRLQTKTLDGRDLGIVTLTGRALVTIVSAFSPHGGVKLQCIDRGRPLSNDARILDFRIFRCEFTQDVRDVGARTGICVEPLRLGTRFAGEVKRLGRLWNSLRNDSESRRVALPLPQKLVQKLAIAADGGGVSISLDFLRSATKGMARAAEDPAAIVNPLDEPPEPIVLHTNASGDFTMMAREHWDDVRGYAEFDLYSFNIDGLLCYAAHFAGAREYILEDPMRIYHIEHGLGSGWTPEGQAKLFDRLAKKGVGYLPWADVAGWAAQMRRYRSPMVFNPENWGLADFDLNETELKKQPLMRTETNQL